jgi:hypothetical protein
MDLIREQYNLKCITHGDIFEHLPTLKEYTKLCNSVAELGVSCMISTWSFLSGLAESDISGNKLLYCVDINNVPNIENVIEEVKKENNVQFLSLILPIALFLYQKMRSPL